MVQKIMAAVFEIHGQQAPSMLQVLEVYDTFVENKEFESDLQQTRVYRMLLQEQRSFENFVKGNMPFKKEQEKAEEGKEEKKVPDKRKRSRSKSKSI